MTLKHFAFVALAGLTLAACDTLDEEQCQTIDWAVLGENDGQRGYPQSRISQHAKACSKHDLTVDPKRYTQGWTRGIRVFCTPQNGYEFGLRGGNYAKSCPADLSTAFLNAYRPAKQVSDLEQELERLEDQRERLVDDLIDLKSAKDDPDLKDRIDTLEDELRDIRSDIRLTRIKLRRAERDLSRYLQATGLTTKR